MGAVCCCCRKDDAGESKEDPKDPIEMGNPDQPLSTTKPDTTKLTEGADTLGNPDKEELPEEPGRPKENSPMKARRKPSTNELNNSIIEEIKSTTDFVLKITLETLEITYKLCDDFGNFFKPFIEIAFDKTVKTLNTMDEEKLNLSQNSENADVNISYNANIPSSIKKSGVNSQLVPKERFYYFQSSVEFFGNDDTKCSSLIFTVKNENSHGHLKILPAIVIGQIRIPIALLLGQKEKSFDGYLSLKLREVIDIGQLKVKIICGSENNNLNNSLMASDGFSNFKKENFNLLSRNSEIEDNSMDYSFNNVRSNLYWESVAVNYTEIDSKIIDKYFFNEMNMNTKLSNLTFKVEQFQVANKIINERVFDAESLIKYYEEALTEENFVLLYEILNQLLKISNQNDFISMNNFFNQLKDQQTEIFFKIHELNGVNAFHLKNFLMILYQLIKSNKKSKVCNLDKHQLGNSQINIPIKRFPKDDQVIDSVFGIIKKVLDCVKKQNIQVEYGIELKDVVIWALNIFNELLTNSENKLDDQQKRAEFTVRSILKKGIYNNSINIMAQRIVLVRLIEYYTHDSALISSLCRVMRKATQVLTMNNYSMIDRELIQGNAKPREIAKQFRTLMIEKYDGIFLGSLNVILHKFQHYSELHYNILIIIFQVINSVEPKTLLEAANKLGLKDFKENFSIYRGKIKTFSKMLNNLHLNILAMFSEINRNNFFETQPDMVQQSVEMLMFVFNDIKSFFRETNTNKKRIEDFKMNKYSEIEIHELITRIMYNLSRVKDMLLPICTEKSITLDIFEFLIKMSNTKKENYIKGLIEASIKKKKNPEDVKKFILSIVENSIGYFRNVFISIMDLSGQSSKGNNTTDKYHNFLGCIEAKFEEMHVLEEIMVSLDQTLRDNQISSTKFSTLYGEIRTHLSKFWVSK